MRRVSLSVGSSLISTEQIEWVQKRIGKNDTYSVHGGVVSVNGSVRLLDSDTEIIVPFGEVSHAFICSHKMTSLINAPVKCKRFYCEENPKIKSLSGIDMECVDFDCSESQVSEFKDFKVSTKRLWIDGTEIRSFRNIHKCVIKAETIQCGDITDSVLGLFFIKGLKEVKLIWQDSAVESKWKDIVNKHLASGKSGVSGATREFIELGMKQYAKF